MHTRPASMPASKTRPQRWGAPGQGGRDQLRGIHARAMGLIAIRYPTGRSACQQFACSLLPRRNDWVCKHNGEQECHTSPPNPNSDRDRQGPLCTGQPLLLLSHAKQDDISTEGVTGSHYLRTPQATKLKKESRPRLPSTADPGPLQGLLPIWPGPLRRLMLASLVRRHGSTPWDLAFCKFEPHSLNEPTTTPYYF